MGWPGDGGGDLSVRIFFGAKKKSEHAKTIFSGLLSKNKGGPKIAPKGRFLALKNVKFFESDIQFVFSQKFFIQLMQPKKNFALKDTSIETDYKKIAKFPKFC